MITFLKSSVFCIIGGLTAVSWAQSTEKVVTSESVQETSVVPLVSTPVADINALMTSIEQAEQALDYSGEYVFSDGLQAEYFFTISIRDGLGLRQRTHGLPELASTDNATVDAGNESDAEIWRRNDDWYELWPGRQVAYAVSPIVALFPVVLKRHSDLNKYYRAFQLNEQKRLAGRLCTPYSVISIEADRPNWYLCVDQENNLLLERHIIDKSNRLMAYMRFKRINIGAAVDVAKAQEPKELKQWLVKTPDRVSVNLQKSGWRMRFPDGFEVISSNELQTGNYPQTMQIVLSDGLAVFSVFIQKLSEQEKLFTIDQQMVMHNTYMYAHRVDDYVVIATGMMPMKTLKNVAMSATFIPPVVAQ